MTNDDEYNQFLRIHQSQLIRNNIPKHFYRRLYEKVTNEIFDSGSYFQTCPVDDDNDEFEKIYNPERRFYVSLLDNVVLDPDNDENAIFLINHVWTYRIRDAKNDLRCIPNLYERMASLMNINSELKDEGIELILQRMWKFNQTYTMTSTDPNSITMSEPYWYIMDELGSSIRHSDTNVNVRCTTFFYEPTQTMFTLLYPIVRIEQPYTEIFRNFIPNNDDHIFVRNIKFLPWCRISNRKTILRSLIIEDCPELFEKKFQNQNEIFEKFNQNIQYDMNQYNLQSKHLNEDSICKVYTDHVLIKQYLNDSHYQLVNDYSQADIIFLKEPIRNFSNEILNGKLINQFPFENIITNKELLALVTRRWHMLYGSSALKQTYTDLYIESHGSPSWLPVTFSLTHELAQFAAYFQYREDQQLDNSWIIKPINLTESIDVSVTNLLDMIIRLNESGPKIACKYVSTPAVLKLPDIDGDGVKFDIRYILLLRNVRPLKLYVHKIFWLRFANKPFSMKEIDDYETHITVSDHYKNTHIRQMNCETFVEMFNQQYHHYGETWPKVEQRIYEMLRELFHCATIEMPPLGIGTCLSSRALYAADIILEQTNDKKIQPKLLEMNFTSDCHRACAHHPNIYNQIFNVLFRDVIDEQHIIDISV